MSASPTSYRLILRSADASHVLLVGGPGRWDLPGFTETGPWRPWHQPGHVIAWAAREGLGDIVVLRCWRGVSPYCDDMDLRVYEAYPRTDTSVRAGRWFAWDAIDGIKPEGQRLVEEWLEDGSSSTSDTPWMRPGWLEETELWIVEQLAELSPTDVATVEQHRVWHKSCLLRARVGDSRFYFKACHPGYPDEAALTTFLAQLHLDHFPEVLAHDPSRRWLLMRELEGRLLEDSDEPDDWVTALDVYAEIQRSLTGRTQDLLRTGCTQLSGRLALTAFDAVNDRETLLVDQPHGLTQVEADRFAALRPLVERTAADLDASKLPLTWVRGDSFAEHAVKVGQHWRFLDVEDSLVTIPLVGLAGWLPTGADAERYWDAALAPWSVSSRQAALDLAHRLQLILAIYGLHRLKTLVLPAMDDSERHLPVIPDRLRKLLRTDWRRATA